MPYDRSIDIDSKFDLSIVENILKKEEKMNKNKFLKILILRKKVLILGGLGLIGKDIVNTYLQLGAKVRVIDIKRDNKHNHNSSISYKYLDLTKNLSSEIIKKSLEGFGCPNIFINCSYPKTKDWEKNNFSFIKFKLKSKFKLSPRFIYLFCNSNCRSNEK